jgi:hypothetical protein
VKAIVMPTALADVRSTSYRAQLKAIERRCGQQANHVAFLQIALGAAPVAVDITVMIMAVRLNLKELVFHLTAYLRDSRIGEE